MTHKSKQHQILVENLNTEICTPVGLLKLKLTEQYESLRKQAKDGENLILGLERSYCQSQMYYDRTYETACRDLALCLELGVSLPVLSVVLFV